MNTHLKIVFGLYGAGRFAREVMPIVSEFFSKTTQANTEVPHQIYFVETSSKVKEINGYPLLSEKDFFKLNE